MILRIVTTQAAALQVSQRTLGKHQATPCQGDGVTVFQQRFAQELNDSFSTLLPATTKNYYIASYDNGRYATRCSPSPPPPRCRQRQP